MGNYFDLEQFKDIGSLLIKLKKRVDLLSKFIYENLPQNFRDLLSDYDIKSDISDELKAELISGLNSIILRDNLYEELNGIVLIVMNDKVRQIKDNKKSFILNKMIIEAAYPKAFKNSNTGIHVDKIIYTPSFMLGPRASYGMLSDPKHLLFILARYKFCAKILRGKSKILEIGCGDGFGSPIVAQNVSLLKCIDINNILIKGNRERFAIFDNISFECLDIVSAKPVEEFDGAYSIDVLEHIAVEDEESYLENIYSVLKDDCIFIIGTPNKRADEFSSEPGASPHINLKSAVDLELLMKKYFKNVMVFSMNDEIVHTGFYPMAHYYFGVGIGKKLKK